MGVKADDAAKKVQQERTCGDGNVLYLDYSNINILVAILHLCFISMTLGKTG